MPQPFNDLRAAVAPALAFALAGAMAPSAARADARPVTSSRSASSGGRRS